MAMPYTKEALLGGLIVTLVTDAETLLKCIRLRRKLAQTDANGDEKDATRKELRQIFDLQGMPRDLMQLNESYSMANFYSRNLIRILISGYELGKTIYYKGKAVIITGIAKNYRLKVTYVDGGRRTTIDPANEQISFREPQQNQEEK